MEAMSSMGEQGTSARGVKQYGASEDPEKGRILKETEILSVWWLQ